MAKHPTHASPTADDQTDRALADLEFTVMRRLDGLLHGQHLGLLPGPGREAGEARDYVAGDDVRRMDWAVTARTTMPHIRETVADRELESWLAVDLSASMDFGTARYIKRDLALAAAAVFSRLTLGGGNRTGALADTGEQLVQIPARSGDAAQRHLMRRLARVPRASPGQRGDLAAMLGAMRRPPRPRGLVVVISDFLGAVTWVRPLGALARRHDVVAVRISDPRDERLPGVGMVTLTDPESGRSRRVRTSAALRQRFAAAAVEHGSVVDAGLRRARVPLLHLATDRDWVTDVVRFVARRQRQWSGTGAGVATGVSP